MKSVLNTSNMLFKEIFVLQLSKNLEGNGHHLKSYQVSAALI